MVKVLQGDLFKSQAQTLVNTVNCVGVMGKGVALEFKNRFPEMFKDYVKRCKAGDVRPGKPYLYKQLIAPWIINFPTKDHWRSISKLSDIIEGLEYLKKHYMEWGITSLAMPPLGCGNGQLEWRVVGPTLYEYLCGLEVPVELYAPHGASVQEMAPQFLKNTSPKKDNFESNDKIRPEWFVLVEIVARIDKEPYRSPLYRTMLQKVAYFATIEGIETGLLYQKSSFGPFAPGVKPMITKLVNNGLLREEKRGRGFIYKPNEAYYNALENYSDHLHKWDAVIEKVTDLFLRMDTKQAEVAATVHFAAITMKSNKEKPTECTVLDEVKQWKKRRRPKIEDHEFALAIRNLNILNWVDLVPCKELPLPQKA